MRKKGVGHNGHRSPLAGQRAFEARQTQGDMRFTSISRFSFVGCGLRECRIYRCAYRKRACLEVAAVCWRSVAMPTDGDETVHDAIARLPLQDASGVSPGSSSITRQSTDLRLTQWPAFTVPPTSQIPCLFPVQDALRLAAETRSRRIDWQGTVPTIQGNSSLDPLPFLP